MASFDLTITFPHQTERETAEQNPPSEQSKWLILAQMMSKLGLASLSENETDTCIHVKNTPSCPLKFSFETPSASISPTQQQKCIEEAKKFRQTRVITHFVFSEGLLSFSKTVHLRKAPTLLRFDEGAGVILQAIGLAITIEDKKDQKAYVCVESLRKMLATHHVPYDSLNIHECIQVALAVCVLQSNIPRSPSVYKHNQRRIKDFLESNTIADAKKLRECLHEPEKSLQRILNEDLSLSTMLELLPECRFGINYYPYFKDFLEPFKYKKHYSLDLQIVRLVVQRLTADKDSRPYLNGHFAPSAKDLLLDQNLTEEQKAHIHLQLAIWYAELDNASEARTHIENVKASKCPLTWLNDATQYLTNILERRASKNPAATALPWMELPLCCSWISVPYNLNEYDKVCQEQKLLNNPHFPLLYHDQLSSFENDSSFESAVRQICTENVDQFIEEMNNIYLLGPGDKRTAFRCFLKNLEHNEYNYVNDIGRRQGRFCHYLIEDNLTYFAYCYKMRDYKSDFSDVPPFMTFLYGLYCFDKTTFTEKLEQKSADAALVFEKLKDYPMLIDILQAKQAIFEKSPTVKEHLDAIANIPEWLKMFVQ